MFERNSKPIVLSSHEQQERQRREPRIEFLTHLARDGRHVICKTIITCIRPLREFKDLFHRNGPQARAELDREMEA